MSERIMAPSGGPQQEIAATILSTKTQPPRHLSPSHWAELTEESGITPAIASSNFRSFGGAGFADPENERQVLLAEAFALGNQQPGHSYQRRMKLQWKYGHLDGGGWRFIGSALPGFAATPRWKPDEPRISGNGRPIKYESQPGRRPGLLLPQVPVTVWKLVAERHGLPMPADRSAGFWAWALATPELPITICEGEKKSCALLGLGLAAVGLAGSEMGRMVLARDAKGRACDEALVPELAALAAGGRRLLICFDADPKPSTARKVEGAAVRLGHLLVKAGAEVRVARLPLLDGAKCGPDDLLVALGADALLEALADGLALAELAWERRYWAERRIEATTCAQLRVGGGFKELVKALQQATAAIVGIRAPKGFGKTKALEQALADCPQVLAVTHRRSLGAAMASRLGLIWRNDTDTALGHTLLADGEVIEGLPSRYCLCADSLLAIKPEAFRGAVLVLDEAEQLLAHLLTSSTCREQRGLLIQRLQAIVANASQVIALDADLSDSTLQWLQQARAGGRATSCAQEVALLVAEGTPQGWPIYWYEESAEQLEQALLVAAAKAPVFVTTDSRERAAALHQLLQHHLPEAKGLLITSATSSTPEVQQWLAKLTNEQALVAGGIRWVVASPSISSGLSIQHLHFRSVFGVFGAGSFDDGEALQALARIRQGVARHIWVKPVVRPQQPPLSGAWWPVQAEGDLRQRWNHQAALLRQQLQPDLLLEPSPGSAAEALAATCRLWADLTSRRNYSHSHLRAFIKARLRAEGHQLLPPAGTISQPEAAELKLLKSQLKGDRQQAHAEAVASAPIISAAEADRQRRLQQHSPALQRRALVERLALVDPEALTPAMVVWAERWAGAAERLACLLEPSLALVLDAKRLAATTPKGEAPLPWDQSFRAQRQQVAEAIGLASFIEQFPLGGNSWSGATPELIELAAKARRYAKAIEQGLAIRIRANDTDTALVGALLLSYGITTTSQRSGSNARNYGADAEQLQLLREAAERLQRKGLGLAPPSAVLEGFANKTACGGAPPAELANPWRAAAAGGSIGLDAQLDDAPQPTSHQLPLAIAGAPAHHSQTAGDNSHRAGAGVDHSRARWRSRQI
ncbi:DUF3854 domain-containing protein [Cyanobium sp. BA5m-21]|uniref:plasmid replication protein, CyRepA1 family n=1 Tax=unclassified Cyanobium TaxID=2627006 RepID=UPI0020CC9163|nr:MULTISPECIES: plasmid replication protein, CyRepA1 family [unclassified Cyanobium]MCP9905543.1 DUF3854 domain-containing protein [Cyanobium sp. BA5m-10]MCP9908267.1 DUF3854 domain-containing protein [Cyanobium sp. BA5m-21]